MDDLGKLCIIYPRDISQKMKVCRNQREIISRKYDISNFPFESYLYWKLILKGQCITSITIYDINIQV